MMEVASNEWISGFWRRIGAFAIDTIILGVVGFGLGLFFEKQFVQLGGWGRIIGFFVALTYFGILNSKAFDGQTIGKKILKIRVVNDDNQPIDIFRSFARYFILGAPYFLNGAQFTSEAMTSFWLYPIFLITFGSILSIAYLYIFNRSTRQSLHDLVVGTYVVNANAERSIIKPIWRPHLIAVGILFLASALVPAFTFNLATNEPFKDLLAAQKALNGQHSVNYVAVSYGTTTITTTSNGKKMTKYLSARVFLDNKSVSDSALAKQLATILAMKYTGSQKLDIVQIILTYGYDIGIASFWNSHSHDFPPKDLFNEN